MRYLWQIVSQVFTVVGLIVLLAYHAPVPFFDHSSVTLMCGDGKTQLLAVAKALAGVIGDPTAELNTGDVQRFLYKDGTSVDNLAHPPTFHLMYSPTAFKSVVLGLFSSERPVELAVQMRRSLRQSGFEVQIISRPDDAFPDGTVVLVLSDAFRDKTGAGFGIIIRKHAFRIGGPRPERFLGWP